MPPSEAYAQRRTLLRLLAFLGLLALAFSAVLTLAWNEDARHVRAMELHEFNEATSTLRSIAPQATPSETLGLLMEWQAISRRVREIRDGRVDGRLAALMAQVDTLGVEAGTRAVQHLEQHGHMELLERLALVRQVNAVADALPVEVGLMLSPSRVESIVRQLVHEGTQEVQALGVAGASVGDLWQAAALVQEMTDLVVPDLRAEYGRVASSLRQRADALKAQMDEAASRGAVDVIMSMPGDNGDGEFARLDFGRRASLLLAESSGIVDVRADGVQARQLRVTGPVASAELLRTFMNDSAFRSRMLALGFAQITVHGSDGHASYDLASGERVRPPALIP
jgi:hypothetical protein